MLKLFNFLRRYPGLIASLLLTSVAAALLEGVGMALVFPVLQGTSQLEGGNYPFPLNHLFFVFIQMPLARRLQTVAVLLLLVTVIKNLFIYAADLFNTRIQLVVIRHFRTRCMEQLMKVGMSYFNKQRASDFQIIIDGYTESVTGAIVGLMGTAVPQFFTMLVLLAFLLLLSWKLTLASMVLVAGVSVVLHKVARNILVASKLVYDGRMNFNRMLLDIIHGMKLIRLFGREEPLLQGFEEKIGVFNAARYKADRLIKMVAPVFEATGIGMLACILFIGAFFISQNGSEWLAVLFTFVVILTRLIGPVKTLNHVRATVIEKIPILQEIAGLLSPDGKEYVAVGKKKFTGLKEKIEFENVSFRYSAGHDVILENISFVIPRGGKIGIVGPSGGGKSSLMELLLRFYDAHKGRVLIDGIDLKAYEIRSFRRRIGVVSQDIFLFNDTVRANIAFAKPQAAEEEIERAARRACAHDFIKELPRGYETVIGERGVLLSGGQRQRIAIARAVLADPEILIFDEATSALDTESERFVQQAIDAVGAGKTVVTIAHRLSTIFDSDKIIVIEKGRIIETGRHEELLSQNGLYAKLVKMQDLEQEISGQEKRAYDLKTAVP